MECRCGCGRETELSKRTVVRRGIRRGDPLPYVRGHAGGAAVRRERITSDLWHPEDRGHSTHCWIWNGTPKTRVGYCTVWIGGKEYSAHRAIYEQEIGPIAAGLQIDHLCRQPSCVNPEHLEAVTAAENIRRGGSTPLTYETVALIRADPLSTRKAGEKYGVSQQTISSVRRGHTWA